MNLYSIAFTADAVFGGKINSEHEIILMAETPEIAVEEAKVWFTKNGAYTGSANPATLQPGTQPQIRNIRPTRLGSIVIYQEKVRDRKPWTPGQDYKEMTEQQFHSYIDRMPGDEYDRRCKEDAEFRKRADEVRA
jgi:hypothetical protein